MASKYPRGYAYPNPNPSMKARQVQYSLAYAARMQHKSEAKKGTTRFFGVLYASDREFLEARGVLEHSCSKGFYLTPTPTQEEKKAFFQPPTASSQSGRSYGKNR